MSSTEHSAEGSAESDRRGESDEPDQSGSGSSTPFIPDGLEQVGASAEPMRLSVCAATDDAPRDLAPWLEQQLRRVLNELAVNEGSLSIAVVDDQTMSGLHEQYRGEAGTTDVLSFDLRDAPKGPLDGELVVCLDEASRQAEGRGGEVAKELLLYAVHGLLHLMGYDDHEEAASSAMHRREDELLMRIGVGAVYDADRCGG